MISLRKFILLFACGLALTACAGLQGVALTAAPLPATQTPPPSPTILWFPLTATSTPHVFATPTTTPERKPGVGEVILTDDFYSPDLWDTAVSDQGGASISRNRLTLVDQPSDSYYMISLRHELTLGNFYVEITARPSLCRGADDYGLLVRAIPVAYYRFALSCDGRARVERISVGTRQLLQPSVLSGDVPPGAPGEVRIGVWAVGAEMRFFLNDTYQFTVTDKNYLSGAIGVFVHAAGDTPVTVTFSNLVAYDVNYRPPTRTPGP